MRLLFLFILLILPVWGFTQNESMVPYQSIEDQPDEFTSGNIVARMIDGLGYRYHWATEGLNDENLQYRPSEDSRTIRETMDHIYGLTDLILTVANQQPNVRPKDRPEMTYEEIRSKTLEMLKQASDLFKSKPIDLNEHPIIFQRGDQSTEYPFWNMLNGPLADAIYHTGQITAFRRAAGNPINPNVSVFRGKNRE